ncbi:MAG: hypothetical protein ABIL09_11070 [Gemmatimonadota bacterium]
MSITYSIDECETKVAYWDAKVEELAELPDSGKIGDDTVSLKETYKHAKERLAVWQERLATANRKGSVARARRYV